MFLCFKDSFWILFILSVYVCVFNLYCVCFIYTVCVCVFMHKSRGLHRSEEDIRSPEDGVTCGEELLTGMLEIDLRLSVSGIHTVNH